MERIFKLKENGTNIRTEIVAGLTTFMTMAYILFVNPNILSGTGMDKSAVFFATAMGAGIVTILMGLFVNFPIALAPGMGLNAYFLAVVTQSNGTITWQTALGAVFISGLIFILLTITKFRQLMVVAIPNNLKYAITVGIGLFITIIGLKISELMVIRANPVIPPNVEAIKAGKPAILKFFESDIMLGNLHDPAVQLAIIGLLIISVLMVLKVRGALLIGIILTTLIGIPMGVTHPLDLSNGFLPDLSKLAVGKLDIMGAIHVGIIEIVLIFTFVELFDTFGTLVGTANKAGLLKNKEEGEKRIGKAMLVDAFGVSFGALMGTSTITSYVESAAGVAEGGKTGLTAVTTGALFILALFLAPFAAMIPDAATAPALIIVGLLMISMIKEINFNDFHVAFPAFLTIITMPFTYNIANGISAGLVSYTLLGTVHNLRNKDKVEIHWLMWVLSILVVLRYIYISE